MADTKEKILNTALRLFARDGYEAVSVRHISEELGMTKGALYRHYKNKRDIFNSIVERMIQIDAQRAGEYQMPVEIYDVSPDSYGNTSLESIQMFTIEQFRFWTEDEFASQFRKMLTLEQYRDPAMARLLQQVLAAGPLEYVTALLSDMTDDPQALALTLYGPMFLLYSVYDGAQDKEAVTAMLDAHIDRFAREWEGRA